MLEAAMNQNVVGNRQNLIQGFALLLQAIEQAGTLLAQQGLVAPVGRRERREDAFSGDHEMLDEVSETHHLADLATAYLDNMRDTFASYDEKKLPDGRLLRRYDTGMVRLINTTSDVIQEESPNGNFILSLPDGKVIFQENPGHPLLLYDTFNMGAPRLARVAMMKVGDNTEATPTFTFSDDEATSLVDMNTLRYYRIARKRPEEKVAA